MEVGKIMMEWSLKNEEYHTAFILYTEFGIGIPNSLLYALPEKKSFGSVRDLMQTDSCKHSCDEYLSKIMASFKKSKYCRLPEWDNKHGYRAVK